MQVNRQSLREGKGIPLCLLCTHALVWPKSKALGLGALHSHADIICSREELAFGRSTRYGACAGMSVIWDELKTSPSKCHDCKSVLEYRLMPAEMKSPSMGCL